MFDLIAPFAPAGDQPQAIAKLTDALASGLRHQVLLGVTGSGKTFTVANRNANRNEGCLDFRPGSYSGHEYDGRKSTGD